VFANDLKNNSGSACLHIGLIETSTCWHFVRGKARSHRAGGNTFCNQAYSGWQKQWWIAFP